MLKIAIIEDTDNDYKIIETNLKEIEKEENESFQLIRFISGEAFLSDYRPVFDLVLLDIELPGMNGMMTAEKFRELDNLTPLIFTTNIASMAIQGYQYSAMDYMLKPVSKEDLSLRIKKIIKSNKENGVHLHIPYEGGVKILSINDILYIESFGHTLIYHTFNEQIKARSDKNMKNLEATLHPHSFSRCNVSYLVNLKYLSAIEGNEVIMVNNERLSISRNKKKEFLDDFFNDFKKNGGII